jgi:hypothetical protein
MDINYLRQYCADQIKLYPNLKEEILDFFYLAIDEIEEGGSERHEIELAINSIEELTQ